MKILILGGTGTMGSELADILSANSENKLVIVSRRKRGCCNNCRYVAGDAMSKSFVEKIVGEKFDVTVDFMWHSAESISNLLPVILRSTGQYFFLSSAAVYANSDEPLHETSPRFIDFASEHEARTSQEYHIAKARAENVVRNATGGNWTIVRPHVTFGPSRFPICTWEMSTWLPCAAGNIPIAIPMDALPHTTTLATGRQVAYQIINLFGKENALGEIFQLGSEDVHTWGEILEKCRQVLQKLGIPLLVRESSSNEISRLIPQMKSRFACDRLLDRRFDMSKYKRIANDPVATTPTLDESLYQCIFQAIAKKQNVATINNYDALAANCKIVGHILNPSMFSGRDRLACFLRQHGFSDRITTCIAFPEQATKQGVALVKRLIKR